MSKINWLEKLGWSEEHLAELRYAGYSYIKQGKYDIALDFFEALIVLNPNSAYDLQTLGALHMQLDHPARALFYFDKALKVQPNHPATMLNLAKTFFTMGKTSEGLKVAQLLKNHLEPEIANSAKALIMAYS